MAPQTLWFTRCPVPTATGIAADLGWFDDEFAPDGITVRSLQDVSSREEAETHYTHTLTGLFREGGNVPALWARARGERTRLLGLTWIEERQVILTRRGEADAPLHRLRLALPRRDIAIDFWRAMALHGFAGALRQHTGDSLASRDLRNAQDVQTAQTAQDARDVQTARDARDARDVQATQDVQTVQTVQTAQATRDARDVQTAWDARDVQGTRDVRGLRDVVLVEVKAGAEAPQWEAELGALAAGEVDAVYVKGALAVEAALRHDAEVAIDLDALPDRRNRINNGTPRPITVHQTLLDEHPELVTRFLAVLLRAADWAAREPVELRRILSAETGAGSAAVASAYVHQPLHPDLSDERLDLLAEQEHFLRTHGFLETAVDVRAWADPAPLAAAHELIDKETP